MDRMQRGYFRLAAENTYLKLKRQEFQAWVGKILEMSLPDDYENIRLTQGDGGLDGIIISRSAIVAVNAPRDQSASTLITKIESDFESGRKTLSDRDVEMKGFIFVHNDEGLTKDVGPKLMALRNNNEGIDVECWSFERIWRELEKLSVIQLEEMFGPGPTDENVARLQMPAIREVVEHLSSIEADAPPTGAIEIPDPEKLEHNSLNTFNQDLLRAGRSKHGLVIEYLEGVTDIRAGEAIAEGFRRKYAACRESQMASDDIFGSLWDFAGGSHFTTPTQHAAVTAVLSYYFHSCDIFENLPEST
ncbi:ABC-three component system protein [Planctomycetes bacterium TBK1r]|uniref:ABC-three component systems C-terminal domain-containing protein n=1 Tax=Stieleria magnilauensis TaxID=2527963 RepID=A0ABX5XH88_9BACT|nr:hypothetical protein TBK1r_02630 [Planctomycetes bacterium TBK1r]